MRVIEKVFEDTQFGANTHTKKIYFFFSKEAACWDDSSSAYNKNLTEASTEFYSYETWRQQVKEFHLSSAFI